MDKAGFSSFLLGLGVGIGIGMLFAPKSGSDTRQMIKDKAGEGTDYVKQRGTDLRDSAGDLLAKGKEALGRQKDSISEAVEAGKQAYRDTVRQGPPPPSAEPAH
jgi:gas vesicle protein